MSGRVRESETSDGHMPQKQIDPDLLQFMAEVAHLQAGIVPSHDVSRQMAVRQAMDIAAAHARASSHGPDRVHTQDGVITLPGRELLYRLYQPAHRPGPLPAMLYAHGGGWVAGSIYTHNALCAELALRTDRAVISLQYRRAPENPFPAAHDDMWAAWEWLYQHGASLGLATHAIALAGDSAGGHLALGCALRHALEGGPMPAPDRLLLWYPNTDRRPDTPSQREYAQGYGLSADDMEYFWTSYEGSSSHDLQDYRLYPGHAPVPGGLAPTVIVTAEHDLLRDEAEHYAARMREAGNQVTVLRAKHMLHGFARLHEDSAAANRWVRRGCLAFMDLQTPDA